ncbi:MAG: ATP-binding protein [Acidobacteria bacterium]|nr:ATP-binding protein [Acidobacteriota bacterium]
MLVTRSIKARIGWYLDQVEILNKGQAFDVGDVAKMQTTGLNEPKRMASFLVGQETERLIAETTTRFRAEVFNVPPTTYSEINPWIRRLPTFDPEVLGHALFLAANGPSDEVLGRLCSLLDECNSTKNGNNAKKGLDFLSSHSWILSLLVEYFPDQNHIVPNDVLKHAEEWLSRIRTKKPDLEKPLINSSFDATVSIELWSVQHLFDERWVELHLLLNCVDILYWCLDKLIDTSTITKKLTDLIVDLVVEPPMEQDIYWQALRLRVLNNYLIKILWHAYWLECKDKQLTLPKFPEQETADVAFLKDQYTRNSIDLTQLKNRDQWSGKDTDYFHKLESIGDRLQKHRAKALGVFNGTTQRPYSILVSSPPGEGKSYLAGCLSSYYCSDKEEGQITKIDCARFGSLDEMMEELKIQVGAANEKLKKGTPMSVFIDEIDRFEDDGVYARMLPFLWDKDLGEIKRPQLNEEKADVDDGAPNFKDRSLLVLVASSKDRTCNDFVTRLQTSPKIKKGRDFLSRIDEQIDLPGISGSSQIGARILSAIVNLEFYLVGTTKSELKSVLFKKIVTAAALNLALSSNRAMTKWIGSIDLQGEEVPSPKALSDVVNRALFQM